MSRRTIIVAVSPEGVIGLHGKIPWNHPGDLQRFKRMTTGGTVIMGRKTWESIGRPLPKRRNLVVTRAPIEGVECFNSLDAAVAASSGDVWFIGGRAIYEAAMAHADSIDVTYVPESVVHPEAVTFPLIDEKVFAPGPLLPHEDDPTLRRRTYERRRG